MPGDAGGGLGRQVGKEGEAPLAFHCALASRVVGQGGVVGRQLGVAVAMGLWVGADGSGPRRRGGRAVVRFYVHLKVGGGGKT